MTTCSISNTRNKKTKEEPPKPTFGTTINDVQAAKNSSSQLPPINSNPTPPIFEPLPETSTTQNSLVLVPQRNTDDDQSSFTELSTADARLTTASNSLENSLLPSEITVQQEPSNPNSELPLIHSNESHTAQVNTPLDVHTDMTPLPRRSNQRNKGF